MKHILRLSVMLFACLIGGTLLAAAKKGIPLGTAKANLIKAVKNDNYQAQREAFDDIVYAFYNTLRPVGSKAGVFEYEHLCIKSLNEAVSAAEKAGVTRARIEEFSKAARARCSGVALEKKPEIKQPEIIEDIFESPQEFKKFLKNSIEALKATTKESLFNEFKINLQNKIIDYQDGDIYKKLSSADKKSIDNLIKQITSTVFSGKVVNIPGAGQPDGSKPGSGANGSENKTDVPKADEKIAKMDADQAAAYFTNLNKSAPLLQATKYTQFISKVATPTDKEKADALQDWLNVKAAYDKMAAGPKKSNAKQLLNKINTAYDLKQAEVA